jgi:hypothetical protein
MRTCRIMTMIIRMQKHGMDAVCRGTVAGSELFRPAAKSSAFVAKGLNYA